MQLANSFSVAPHVFFNIILALFLATQYGCASKTSLLQDELNSVQLSHSNLPLANNTGWWRAAIRINPAKDIDSETVEEGNGEENEMQPLWHFDVFLAHAVMAKVIEKHRGDIRLWRFHRRATQDETGHQFSFAFYSTPGVADEVFAEIDHSPLFQIAITSHHIKEVIYDDTSVLTSPAISDTSDNNWSSITQKAWPYYIMGASQMWLDMINNIIQDNPPADEKFTTFEDLLDYYAEVNEVLTDIWRDEAQHAFLHHLNALFGYEPMLYFEPRLIRF